MPLRLSTILTPECGQVMENDNFFYKSPSRDMSDGQFLVSIVHSEC